MGKTKKIITSALVCGLAIGLFYTDIKVCYSLGINKRIERENQEAKTEKARKTAIKMEQAEMVGRCVEREQAEELAKKQLQEELQAEADKHKYDKPAQAVSKPLTKEEKEDLNKG